MVCSRNKMEPFFTPNIDSCFSAVWFDESTCPTASARQYSEKTVSNFEINSSSPNEWRLAVLAGDDVNSLTQQLSNRFCQISRNEVGYAQCSQICRYDIEYVQTDDKHLRCLKKNWQSTMSLQNSCTRFAFYNNKTRVLTIANNAFKMIHHSRTRRLSKIHQMQHVTKTKCTQVTASRHQHSHHI